MSAPSSLLVKLFFFFCLEAESGEEPFVLARAEAVLEDVLHLLLHLAANTLTGIELVGVEDLGEGGKVEGVAGGHDVVPVHDLHEGLDGGAAHDLTLGHALEDLLGSPVDPGDDAVAVVAVALGGVDGLDDDGLVAGESAVEHDNDLTRLKERLGHFLLLVYVCE